MAVAVCTNETVCMNEAVSFVPTAAKMEHNRGAEAVVLDKCGLASISGRRQVIAVALALLLHHRASAPREPCLPPGSSEALHSVAACVHGPIWICQVALAPTAVCARGMRAHCRPPVCAQSRSLHTSSSLFKSGGCGALDAVKAFISGAPP